MHCKTCAIHWCTTVGCVFTYTDVIGLWQDKLTRQYEHISPKPANSASILTLNLTQGRQNRHVLCYTVTVWSLIWVSKAAFLPRSSAAVINLLTYYAVCLQAEVSVLFVREFVYWYCDLSTTRVITSHTSTAVIQNWASCLPGHTVYVCRLDNDIHSKIILIFIAFDIGKLVLVQKCYY